MNINDIKIPVPFQFSIDDLGWMDGRIPFWDDWQPTRTGIPRLHTIEDYEMLNEIGRSVNMKIVGMFVMGDWDRKGILRDVPYSNRLGKNWTGSQYIDEKVQSEIRDFLNSCEYLEIGMHGLLHECWDDNGNHAGSEFTPSIDFNTPTTCEPPESYIRAHVDAFFEILKDQGFNMTPRALTFPSYCEDPQNRKTCGKVFSEYGFKYWNEMRLDETYFNNGIMINGMPDFIGPWEAFDMNPDKIPVFSEDKAGIICGHWPNFLRFDPELSITNLNKWTSFLNRQAEVFGVVLSRDIAFAHNQLLYRHNCTISEVDGKIKIDFSAADALAPSDFDAPIYISVKKGVKPFECEGGTITEYDVRSDFISYEIKRNSKCDVYLKPLNA